MTLPLRQRSRSVGHDEIIARRQALAGRWSYTSTVTGSDPISAAEYRVSVHVAGDFPGGVADLAYRFRLRDGLIDKLSIVA